MFTVRVPSPRDCVYIGGVSSLRQLTQPVGLRIHQDTERGDNDTIKFSNGATVKIDGKTCAER